VGVTIDATTRPLRSAPEEAEAPETNQGVVEIHIEEVVLRNFPPSNRSQIGDGLETVLADLVARRGLPVAQPMSLERLDAGSFKVAPGAKAQAVGGGVAEAVYQQLSPAHRNPLNGLKRDRRRSGS
jgi:hypothetical protein